jgi:hypothetical protein
MNVRWTLLGAATTILSGCVVTPNSEPAPGSPPAAPVLAPTPVTAQSARSLIDALEHQHRERAQAHEGERNWADALVQWELLTLLKPDSQEYRDAVVATRSRIQAATAGLLRAAELARKQGNLEQAALLYLRVLNLDRGDASAAKALREMDIERTQRTYFNRPPRG